MVHALSLTMYHATLMMRIVWMGFVDVGIEKLVQESNQVPIAMQRTVYASAPHQLTHVRVTQINAPLICVHVEVTKHVMWLVKSARKENACAEVSTAVEGNYQGLIVIAPEVNVNVHQQ